MIDLRHYLVVAGFLFCAGITGIFIRRSLLMILLCIELALGGANLAFVAFAAYWGDLSGQAVVFFTMIVSAAEVAIGLAVVVLLFRKKGSACVEDVKDLRS